MQTLLGLLMVAMLSATLAACSASEPDPSVLESRGLPRDVVALASVPLDEARAALDDVGLAQVTIEQGVNLSKVVYETIDAQGAPILASLLLAAPSNCAPVAVISYQHGTAFRRDEVPSRAAADDADDRSVPALAFAGHCYLVVASDYVGLGVSPGRHPFMHAGSEASAVIDAWRAARQVAEQQDIAWPRDAFLVGFSQGAHATMAAAAHLPADFSLRALAGISGPYNLSDIQLAFTLEGESPVDSAYLGYILSAYAQLYPAPASGAYLMPPYDQTLAGFFDGSQRIQDLIPDLPATPHALLTPEFAGELERHEVNWFSSALADNDVDGVVPSVPVQLYYSSTDEIVTPEQATHTAVRMRQSGVAAEAIDIGPIDHLSSWRPALGNVRSWFDELLAQPPVARE
jgi:pimeloyl-ACP methyl ester carboxylesterase